MGQTKVLLLIVDPQNDFCHPMGQLYVPGAEHDMQRLAEMIQKNRDKIGRIEVTLDSHHWIHIAHPYFWTNDKGEEPLPFTKIRIADVVGPSPKWRARCPKYVDYSVSYVKKLSEQKKYEMTIWPPHCIIGTWGHNIFPPLMPALHFYEETFSDIHYTLKGSNPLAEHYSAIKAEIVNPEDPSTDINKSLLERISNADRVIVAGEALSHCVANTARDIFKYLGKQHASKFVILKDTSSNIRGFEDFGSQFIDEMLSLNVQVADTTNCFD